MDNLVGTIIKWKGGNRNYLIEGSTEFDYSLHHIGTKSYYTRSIKDTHKEINKRNILIIKSPSKALIELNYEIY